MKDISNSSKPDYFIKNISHSLLTIVDQVPKSNTFSILVD